MPVSGNPLVVRRWTRTAVVALAAAAVAGCVRYRAQAVAPEPTARALSRLSGERLSFEDAVRRLVRDNAELRRLRAEAEEVNTTPGPDALRLRAEVMDGELGETMLGGEVLSLFGIGPRRALTALRRAEQDERVFRHHERARALVASLAEAFAVDRALGELSAVAPSLDVEAFRAAGLASGSSLAAAEAVAAEAAAEEEIRATERRDVRREIARLLGAEPGGEVEPVAPAPPWPPVAPPDATQLVFARGDLLRQQAAFRVADQRLRYAVARQWPSLGIGLGGNVALESPMQMVEIALPLDAPAEARAMARARETARRAYEETLLDALHDASAARLELERASARMRAAVARRDAAEALVRSAQGRIAAEAQAETAFDGAVLASMESVRAAMSVRESSVAAARARARAALAAGWPGPRIVEEACR